MGFEVLNCHKLSQKVSELKIQKKDSELFSRECVFWIDIEAQRCYVKKFSVSNSLTGMKKVRENSQITLNQDLVQADFSKNQDFTDHGLFEIKVLGSFFNDRGYIDQMCA